MSVSGYVKDVGLNVMAVETSDLGIKFFKSCTSIPLPWSAGILPAFSTPRIAIILPL